MSNILEIKDLTKHYLIDDGKKEVLNKINLTIKKGSFFGLLGPNGAGKSTLINIIAGITNKTSGSVKICGYDLDKEPEAIKKSIGVVPQEVVYDPFFTVRETLENYAGYFGIPSNNRRTEQIIEAVGLTKQADYNTRKLSGGMKRRLLIAKALVNNPKLLFLDEPTAGVDIELREQLWKYIRELNKNGTTIVLTTHYLEEAEQLCSDIALINNGRIITHQKKNELLESCYKKIVEVRFGNKVSIAEIKNSTDLEFQKIDEFSVRFFCYNPNEVDILVAQLKNISAFIADIRTIDVKLEDVIRNLIVN